MGPMATPARSWKHFFTKLCQRDEVVVFKGLAIRVLCSNIHVCRVLNHSYNTHTHKLYKYIVWVNCYYSIMCCHLFSSTSTVPEQIALENKRELKNMTAKHHLLASEKTEWKPLSRSDINSIKYFLLFIGWPRSCHSIVGSLLDAHPNVIVAHEFFLFTKLSEDKELSNRSRLYNQLYRNSYMSAKEGWRTSNKTQKGYSLDMAGSWQGQFTKLEVIGDKCGGELIRSYAQNSKKF